MDTLPYPPAVAAALGPLRRVFKVVNRTVAAPAIRYGLGPLLTSPATGSICVLRTVGRTSGLVREAPLGYLVSGGRVVVCAGYGRGTQWFRNALAHPGVEVALPGAVLAGLAEEVTDPPVRDALFTELIAAMGAVGRAVLGDVAAMGPDEVRRAADAFPLLAVTPTAVLPGPFEPGGVGTRWSAVAWLGLTALLARGLTRRR